MNLPDAVNGGFELLAGFMILNNCRTVIRDKAVAGVSIVSTMFFSGWGMWNLWYYPHLGQMASFYGGLMIVVANCIWVGLMFKYAPAKKTKAAKTIDAYCIPLPDEGNLQATS